MYVKITNKLNSPRLAMMVERGILDALAGRGAEDWWVGLFEFDARQAFQVVLVGPGPCVERDLSKTGRRVGSQGVDELRG